MPITNIKKIYNDALYWSTSRQSKEKDYHLTRTQEAILRKLIHYSTKNEKITYSNKIISAHTFIDAEVIRKEIPKIVKKGFISSSSTTISERDEVYKRRTIFIKWGFIQKVLNDIPINEEPVQPSIEPEEQSVEEPNVIKEQIETIQQMVKLTQEKIDWAYDLLISHDPSYQKEDIHKLNQEQLAGLFYPYGGLWEIDEDTKENKYLWRIHSISGSKYEVYSANNTSQKLNLNIHNLEAYLDTKGITFEDFDQSVYDDIMTNGLPKRQLVKQG